MGNRSCRGDWRPGIDRHWTARTSRPAGSYITGVSWEVQAWRSRRPPCFWAPLSDGFVDSVQPLSSFQIFSLFKLRLNKHKAGIPYRTNYTVHLVKTSTISFVGVMYGLYQAMEERKIIQQCINDQKKNGFEKSHSKTMSLSAQTRFKLTHFSWNIIIYWQVSSSNISMLLNQ